MYKHASWSINLEVSFLIYYHILAIRGKVVCLSMGPFK